MYFLFPSHDQGAEAGLGKLDSEVEVNRAQASKLWAESFGQEKRNTWINKLNDLEVILKKGKIRNLESQDQVLIKEKILKAKQILKTGSEADIAKVRAEWAKEEIWADLFYKVGGTIGLGILGRFVTRPGTMMGGPKGRGGDRLPGKKGTIKGKSEGPVVDGGNRATHKWPGRS